MPKISSSLNSPLVSSFKPSQPVHDSFTLEGSELPLLEKESVTPKKPLFNPTPPWNQPSPPPVTPSSYQKAAAGYARQAQTAPSSLSSFEKYKDDQLLSNPGGDHYDLKNKKVFDPPEKTSFGSRIGKDLSDAFGNVKNFFSNLLMGSKAHYRDTNGRIQEFTQRGFLGSTVDFFKDLGSGLSLGLWRPDGEAAPRGLWNRITFSFAKIKEAVFADAVEGVGGSVNHMVEDVVLAGWNLVETVPDSTIGNVEVGEKLTTAVFDNGQVVVDYVTDVLPAGEGWQRVHSCDLRHFELPVLNNLKKPEHEQTDDRFRHVRNTPFRKTIETLGALAADVFTFSRLGRMKWSSEKKPHQG